MKIGEYEQMMAYLTRPGFSGGSGKKPITIKELKDSGKIVTGDKYTPSNPKLIQAIRRFEEKFPRKKNDIGGRQIAERPDGPKIAEQPGGAKIAEPPKSMQMDTTTSNPIPEYDINDFRNDAEIYVLMLHNNTIPKGDIADKLNSFAQKGIDAGTFSMQDAGDMVRRLIGEVKDRARYQRLRDVVPEGIGTVERDNRAIGGGVIEGEDLGTREGFAGVVKAVSKLPKDQQKYINKWLDDHPGVKWEDLTSNERNMLKRGQDVRSGTGSKTKKGAENPQFQPLDDEGKKIAKQVYGTTDVSDNIRQRINKGEITMDTKPVKFEKGKDISLKMKRGSETVTGVNFPEKTIDADGNVETAKQMEKRLINFLRNRVQFSKKGLTGTGYANADIAAEFPIGEKQAGRLARYYINKLGLKYKEGPRDPEKASVTEKATEKLKVTSGIKEERKLTQLKTKILEERNLARKVDKAHRVSKSHMEKLGLQFDTNLLGMDSRIINQVIVKPSEIKLNNLYARQRKILDLLKENPNSAELKKQMTEVNKGVKQIVKDTSGRLIGVTIDLDTLEPTFEGVKKKNTFTKFLGDNYKIADLNQFSDADLSKAIAKAVDAEVKRGFVPNDFKNILSNKESQKAMLNYAKKVAPDAISGLKQAFLNPTSKVGMKLLSTFPSITTAGLVGYGGYKVMGFDQEVRADDISKQKEEFDPEKADPTLTTALGAAGAYKYGPQLLKILKNVGRGTIKTLGSLPAALTYAGFETKAGMDEGKNFADAVTEPMVGLNLLLPETVKKLGPLMAKGARISTPVGTAITGIGTLKNRAQNMIRTAEELAALQATPYQQNLIDEYAAADYRGYGLGGRVGFADGPEDPSKRKFMKIIGGLASLPIVGRFFDIGEKAAPVVKNIFTKIEKLKNTKTLMPDWFPSFVDKFRKEGKAENMFRKERIEVSKAEYDQAVAEGKNQNYFHDAARTEEYKANNPDYKEYYKIEDTDELIGTTYTNDKFPGVEIDDFDGEVSVNWENDYSQPVNITYVKPGAKGPDLGRPDKVQAGIAEQEIKPEGEFSAMDQEVYATDPDGGFDTEEVIVDTLDDMMEGTTRQMEEYATGKKVKNLSRGEGKVIEAEVRANQMAEEVGGADYEGDPINLMDDRDYGDAGFDD